MKHLEAVWVEKEDPDVVIESKQECPLSVLFGITEDGRDYLQSVGTIMNLPRTEETGGFIVDNATLVDMILTMTEKGLIVK